LRLDVTAHSATAIRRDYAPQARVLQREQAVAHASSLLTARELEVTRILASGLRNEEIASRREITEGTVKFDLRGIYEKVQIDGR
jgi:DNA-binding CsgD family transcriptional regulator